MTRDEAVKIIEAYGDLLKHALDVVSDEPFYSGVDENDCPTLCITKEAAILTWRVCESDGCRVDEECKFPLSALLMSKEELAALRKAHKAEMAALIKKEKAEHDAAAAKMREAYDRHEYERLKAKFGG